jgi:hypothetical protein
MGAFFFGLASLKFADLARTAHHCIVLALIFVLPTMFLGILDWQHFYQGEWSGFIATKFVLTGLLATLLTVAAVLGRKKQQNPKIMVVVYTLCLFNVIGLGFTGGEIQYG